MSSESAIEGTCRERARRAGARLIKITKITGWPDRALLVPGGETIYIEFKKPFGELSKLQDYLLKELTKSGFKAYEVDSVPLFMRILEDGIRRGVSETGVVPARVPE